MARISNKDKYIPDQKVTPNDYLIGSDFEKSGKTKNFTVDSLFRLLHEYSGSAYVFSDGTLKSSDGKLAKPTTAGYMFTNNNEVNPENVSEITINRECLKGTEYISKINLASIKKELFVLKVFDPNNLNNTFYFKVDYLTHVQNANYIRVNVNLSEHGYVGKFEKGQVYVFEIEPISNADLDVIVTGDKYFRYEQGVPSSEWVIKHNLGKNPSVTVTNSAKEVVRTKIEYIDNNTVKSISNSAFSGFAELN